MFRPRVATDGRWGCFASIGMAPFVIAAPLFGIAVAAPVLATHGHQLFALAIAAFFSKLCHQHPDRSLILFGAPIAVCARCLGIYAGAVFGGMLQIERRTAIRLFACAVLLNCTDVVAEHIGLHGNMPLPRLLIGALAGLSAAAVLTALPEDATPPEKLSGLR